MYLEHFGLTEPPFSITPDPRFVVLSERHRDALAHLNYGVGQGGGGGFVQLTGEVGTGKTTLCRLLLERLPGNVRVALVLNPRLSPVELLESIGEELGLDVAPCRGSVKRLVDALNAYLLDAYARGLRVVLIIDEAQNLSVDALEQVRLLTNLETSTQKLLQIILLGQPELRAMLARDDMRQLAQRITARFHLLPMSAPETGAYLRHRFGVAGGTRFPFTPGAVQRIHARAGGVPRLVNAIAERTLLAGYVHERTELDEALVELAAREVFDAPAGRVRGRLLPRHRRRIAGAVAAAIALVALGWWIRPGTALAPATAQASAPRPDARAGVPPASTPRAAATAPPPSAPAAELLRRWRLSAGSSDVRRLSTCPPLFAPGVYCARGRATLPVLSALGRPVLLTLAPPDGGPVDARLSGTGEVLLLGAGDGNVGLWRAGRTLQVPEAVLAQRWRGDYTALLAPADLLAHRPAPGASGPAIDWLRTRLSHPGPPVLDEAMRGSVRRFQQARGLRPDGVLGPETRLRLASDDAGPRLE